MFLEKVKSEGLGHLSYIIGDGGKAAVIDPRRDCKIYVEIASKYGCQITHIFETHRNEDYVIGSLELARRTGAEIYHGKALKFKYGKPVSEKDHFNLGNIRLAVLETPGHTPESISIVLEDKGFSSDAIGVFTGDALFIGDVGRTDFYANRKEELAGALYDSIHDKLLKLGDHVILYPAHGEGSVCGSNLASREFSTLGYERLHNPMLQLSRKEFIKRKVSEEHHYAPYFKQMEKFNQDGIPLQAKLPEPKPVGADDFANAMEKKKMLVLDIRSPEAFAGSHIPGSLSIPLSMLPAYAGWFLPYDKEIGMVLENEEDAEQARIYLMRIGYDNVTCYLKDGIHAWNASGRRFDTVSAIHVKDLKERVAAKKNFMIVDVRTHEEYQRKPSQNSMQVFLGELPQHLKAIPRNRTITTFCATGRRAIIAASILKQTNMFSEVEVCLGAMQACTALEKAHNTLPEAA